MQKREVLARANDLLNSAGRVGADKNPVISALAVLAAFDPDDRHAE